MAIRIGIPRIQAFAAELERVNWIEAYIRNAVENRLDARQMACEIEQELSKPASAGALVDRIEATLLNTEWQGLDPRVQSLRSILEFVAREGALLGSQEMIICRLADAVLTECRLATVDMVDAAQRELNDGATNFMRVWLKAWERA